jgi:hypothetical protein
MKNSTAGILLAGVILLGGSASPETVKRSTYVEGTVVRAQRFRKGLRYTTKISLKEDADHEAADSRRFCGNWEKQLNNLRGKHVRLNLEYKEYAPNECWKINKIELLN